jgi:hypothetical protein
MRLYTSGALNLFPLDHKKHKSLSHKEAQKSQREIINLLCAFVAKSFVSFVAN